MCVEFPVASRLIYMGAEDEPLFEKHMVRSKGQFDFSFLFFIFIFCFLGLHP